MLPMMIGLLWSFLNMASQHGMVEEQKPCVDCLQGCSPASTISQLAISGLHHTTSEINLEIKQLSARPSTMLSDGGNVHDGATFSAPSTSALCDSTEITSPGTPRSMLAISPRAELSSHQGTKGFLAASATAHTDSRLAYMHPNLQADSAQAAELARPERDEPVCNGHLASSKMLDSPGIHSAASDYSFDHPSVLQGVPLQARLQLGNQVSSATSPSK